MQRVPADELLAYLKKELEKHSVVLHRGEDGAIYAIKQPRPKIESVYWGMLRDLQKKTGHTVEELHEYLRDRYVGDSTRQLDEEEWRYYIDQVREWSIVYG